MGITGIAGFFLYKFNSSNKDMIIGFAIIGLIAAIPFLILCLVGVFAASSQPMSLMVSAILLATASTITMIINAFRGFLHLHKLSLAEKEAQ